MSKEFVDSTEKTMVACGRWFMEHAGELAERVSDGCKDWEIIFSAGDNGKFPHVHLSSTNVDVPAVIANYETADFHGYPIEEVEKVFTEHRKSDYAVEIDVDEGEREPF